MLHQAPQDSLLCFEISASRSNTEIITTDQLDSHSMPSTVMLPGCRTVPNAVNGAEIADDLLIDSLEVFQLARLIYLIAALRGQQRKLLSRNRISSRRRAVPIRFSLRIEINRQNDCVRSAHQF